MQRLRTIGHAAAAGSPTADAAAKPAAAAAAAAAQGKVFRVRADMKTRVDPDVTFGLLADFEGAARVFRSVAGASVECTGVGRYVVSQRATWRFLVFSGVYSIKMNVWEDARSRTLLFSLAEPGLFRSFNGLWAVDALALGGGAEGSHVVLEQELRPSFVPPGPLAQYAVGIMRNQVRNVFGDLEANAARVKKQTMSRSSVDIAPLASAA
eukprot:SM000092S24502  [mRNA]  locus=s92:311192:312135:+ [translate_table: standard]